MNSVVPAHLTKIQLTHEPRFGASRVFHDLNDYRPSLHTVLNWCPIDIGYLPPSEEGLPDDLFGVYCKLAVADELSNPDVDLLCAFSPNSNRHEYRDAVLKPSVLYWRGEFWTHVLNLGQTAEHVSAVIYAAVV